MKRLLLILALATPIFGQFWSSVLDSNRAIDWTSAGATITNRSTVCTTLSPGVTAAQIVTAINACNNGVVVLNAGTYSLSASIVTTHSNFTLRGAGPDQTFLNFTATSSNCNGIGGTSICIWNGDSEYVGGPGNVVNWTAGYTKGTTNITLSAVTNLKVGSLLVLDQTDLASDPGNTIWACQSSGSNGNCSQQGASGVARAGRSQSQTVTVTDCRTDHAASGACNTTSITISPGLYAPNWSGTQTPQGWYSSTLPISGVGIENLSVSYANMGDKQAGIMYHNATQCWVKNFRSVNSVTTNAATRKHVMIWQSTHITVRDSYFYGSSDTSEGYGVDAGSVSADNLVENNIFQHMAVGNMNEGTTGTVYGYNYAVDNFYNNGAPNWQQYDNGHHSAGDSFILWEGHEGIEFEGDTIHGTSWMITHFRSYLNGHDVAQESCGSPGCKNQATFAYFPAAYSRYYNLVGSVLGTASYDTHYENKAQSTTDCNGNNSDSAHSVFVLDFSDQGGTAFSPACLGETFRINNDSLTSGTLMRWGNYAACTGDALCNVVRFQASENASSAPTYPGLANPSQTLPNSFYLSAMPSWWISSLPFPAVGPDVDTTSLASNLKIANVGNHVALNPAANCYLNVMGGSTNGLSGALTFNADTCYTEVAISKGLQGTVKAQGKVIIQ